MGVRAYGRETLASLPIDVDKNWNDRSISNVNSLQANEHITVTARGANRKLYPALNRYDSETDGWYVSKDNNDIERKFWKDDFSVDSREQYTFSDPRQWSYDSVNQRLTHTTGNSSSVAPNISVIGNVFSVVFSVNSIIDGSMPITIRLSNPDVNPKISIYGNGVDTTYVRCYSADGTASSIITNGYLVDTETRITVDLDNNTVKVGTSQISFDFGVDTLAANEIRLNQSPNTPTWHIYYLTVSPSISYSDDFTSDTVSGANGRYQVISGGTISYDDVNHRMLITKTSGTTKVRKKSYKYTDGGYSVNFTAPTTGTDGDFIGLRAATSGDGNSGFTVGIKRVSGTWNVITREDLTAEVATGIVTDIADGDDFTIELERDTARGVTYYYVYKITKPTAPTGKLFHLHQEAYVVIWYVNADAAEKTIAVNDISIRAESIVGRTNVQLEEPFWFRDDFGENSVGRWTSQTQIISVSDGHLVFDSDILSQEKTVMLGIPSIKPSSIRFDWTPTALYKDANRFVIAFNSDRPLSGHILSGTSNTNYLIQFIQSGGNVTFYKYVSAESRTSDLTRISGSSSYSFSKPLGESYAVSIDIEGDMISLSIDGVPVAVYQDTGVVIPSGYVGFMNYRGGAYIDNLQISGTRVYQKPIHRGAMLETYHDGTQEVVGTTFIDDCQWDRLAEYVKHAGWAHNAVNGYYSNTGDLSLWTKDRYGDGTYQFRFHAIANSTSPATCRCHVPFFSNGQNIKLYTDNPNYTGACYYLELTAGSTAVVLWHNTGTGNGNSVTTFIGNFTLSSAVASVGSSSRIELVINNNVASLKVDGLAATNTITLNKGLTEGYFGFNSTPKVTVGAEEFGISEISIIAASSDATNGIAACIPPIGGGARYGEQEKVYKQLVNAAKFGEYKTTASIKTTNADAEAIEMYFKNITDTTNVATDDTDTLAISLSDTNYAMSTKDLQLLHGDRGDTIEVAVRKTSAATEVSPTCYVTDLMILPKVEG